jgi:putative chitinase
MAGYIDTLNPKQKENLAILTQRMVDKGITNSYTQGAINAVVSKESSFIPRSENLTYSAQRIMQVWPRISASVASTLANNPTALGNYVYGPTMNASLGNGPSDGYKYRGRGLNQLTGRANYKKYGDALGYDLINNPDLLNDIKVASDVAILFFQNGIKALNNLGTLQKYYNSTDINAFKTAKDSLGAIYHVNAGVGSSQAKLSADVTGGLALSRARVNDFVNYISSNAIEVVKKNPKKIIFVSLFLGLTVTGIIMFYNKNK